MSNLGIIAVREYLENVKTKAFLVAVLMTPVLMGLSFLIPVLLQGQKVEQRRIAVADVTGLIGQDVAHRLSVREARDKTALYGVETVPLEGTTPAERAKAFEAVRDALETRILSGKLFAYVLVRPSALERKKDTPPSEYRTANLVDVEVAEHVRADVAEAANARVVAESGVPAATAAILTAPVALESRDVRAQSKAGSAAATVLPFVFTLLLFLTIISVSQALITSTLEEKANRVIEVLLSSVSPFQLMAGKILGTCAVGLTLMTVWAMGGLAGLMLNGLHVVTTGQLGLCVVYYLLGFLFFASLMVAVGSACNTLKEAQNLLAPVMSILTISMFFLVAVGRDPQGTLARVLSLIPLFTPFLMMMRVAATPPPPAWEIGLSIALLAGAAALGMRFAARVFRIGVLMYGKPPSLRELARWIRTRN